MQAEDKLVAVACGLNHDGLEQPAGSDGPGELLGGGFVEVPRSEAAGFNPVHRDLRNLLRHQVPLLR